MFQQSPGTSNGTSGGLSRTAQALGTVIAIGAAILATPLAYRYTRDPLLAYLTDAWGSRVGEPLTWAFGGVEALTIYYMVKLTFTSLVTWCMAAFAARRL